jgi:hypothetical protein
MNGEAPHKKRRTWIWIVLGVFVLLVFVAIGGVFVAVSFFRQNFSVSENMSQSSADAQFEAIRAKFAGQQPLIEMRDGKPQYVVERASESGNGKLLSTMHIVAFDQDEGKVVNFSLPFWILRMKSGPIRISAYQQGWDDHGVSFRIEDIEKHGPGIIVDHKERDEGRVLIWAE